MKVIIGVLALACLLLGFHSSALALPSWDTHYQVEATITTLGPNHYLFEYNVKNLDQGSGNYSGLDDFFVQIPLTATLSNITDPPPYIDEGGANWIHNLPNSPPNVPPESGYQWLQWFGAHYPSVYPVGTTAHFSFEASGVGVGENPGVAISYFFPAATYIYYEDNIQGPSAIPLPGAVWLLGSGLLGLVRLSRFRKS